MTAGRSIGPIVIPPGRRPAACREVTGEDRLRSAPKKGERLKSPCINICEFDADVCRGCGRTRQEIRARKRADKAEQRLILAEADLRLLVLQARGRRKFR